MPAWPVPRAEGRPLVLGHRGASREAPENTLAAFRLAMAQGADGFELDVWRCGSGEPVVIHDPSAARTTGEDLDVRLEPLSRLRRLDASALGGSRDRGERIPTLAEVLEDLPGAVVNVELKAGRVGDPRLAAAVARTLRRQPGAEGRILVSSFDPFVLGAFRLWAPEVPVGLLLGADRGWEVKERIASALGPSAVHPALALATDARIAGWLGRGLAVTVWTVDEPAEQVRLARAGATAIISNLPGPAREAVRRATGR